METIDTIWGKTQMTVKEKVFYELLLAIKEDLEEIKRNTSTRISPS